MPDREKVIKGLEYCHDTVDCRHCPYPCHCVYADDWPVQLMTDALALLKEQDAVVRCKDCVNFIWDSISQNAGSCGIGIGTPPNYWHSKDWFCANGEVKDDG